MSMKKILSDILKKSTDSINAKNTASVFTGGVEDMPKSLKNSR